MNTNTKGAQREESNKDKKATGVTITDICRYICLCNCVLTNLLAPFRYQSFTSGISSSTSLHQRAKDRKVLKRAIEDILSLMKQSNETELLEAKINVNGVFL